MSRFLWLKLVLPLGLLSAAALGIHHWWDYDSALINLGSGLLIVIVTISYVDWVLRRHEAERWAGTDARVGQRLEVFTNALVMSVRTGLGFGPEVLNRYGERTDELREVHQRVMKIAEDLLIPEAQIRIAHLDEVGWKRLASSLQSVSNEAERILDRFFNRLQPMQVECLLDIQSCIGRALIYWQIYPDVMGLPLARLPKAKTPPEVIQRAGCESTAREIQHLMKLAIKLEHVRP